MRTLKRRKGLKCTVKKSLLYIYVMYSAVRWRLIIESLVDKANTHKSGGNKRADLDVVCKIKFPHNTTSVSRQRNIKKLHDCAKEA